MARRASSAFIDLRPLTASPAFARLWAGSTLSGLGGQLTIVAVMLQMYAITGDTFAVSMIAVAGLVPMVLAGLYGGMLADAFDRRQVALIAASVTFASTLLLAVLTWGDWETQWWLYGVSVVNSAANSIVQATRQAIVPRLIARELLPAASALNGVSFGLMMMAGPALAGLLVATVGYAWTYSADVFLMTSLFMGLWTLPSIRPEGARLRPGLESLRDGWRFLKRAGNIRVQYLMDMTAMTFGQPLTLYPAIGAVLLGGGAITTGVLTAAVAVGAFASSLFSGPIGRARRHGLGIARAVTVYGATMTAFALVLLIGALKPGADVRAGGADIVLIVAASLALAVSGAADNVSAIYRATMMQTAVPDEMRGRLQGIYIAVVAGGPRIGALYAGALATITALWVPQLVGGLIIMGIIAVLLRTHPRFRAYDAVNPEP